MSHFFIKRPIFAWVIAILIMLGGVLAIMRLPIAQYPQIAPTVVTITATYPGANAQTAENSVTKVIEQNMTGLDHLQYMSSSSTSTGVVQISLTFTNEADADIAQVQVQNKLQLATPLLPQVVQQQGIKVVKSSASFLMVLGFVSADGRLAASDIADYVASSVNDPISRVAGVGQVTLFGAEYAMRIWLDPDKLTKYNLMPGDVIAAIQTQNTQVTAGQLGGLPSVGGQQLNATITSQSRLQTVEQFKDIILRTATSGQTVRIGDVARVELGSKSYDSTARYNGKPAAGMGISLATGANAVATSEAVKARVAQLSATMPEGLRVVYPYDTTPFVKLSIEKVIHTLFEAIALVFVVMFVFLQSWRATIIPTIAVPVVLLGTFGVLSLAGYSINTLTMFAMVLAIGLLVDDAIVVVENVERVMVEEHLGPREATEKSMREITGALVGIGVVLSAVFIPMAFFNGSVGIIYRQFALTIVTAMLLSVLVALVLTPALCATILKPPKHHGSQRGFFGLFNRGFDRMADGYQRAAGGAIRRVAGVIIAFAAIVAGMVFLFQRLPSSFLPEEDQGTIMTLIQLPVGATSARTLEVIKQVEHQYLDNEKDAVEGVFAVSGFSFAGQGQNVGLAFVSLKPFDERKHPGTSAQAVVGRAMGAFMKIRDAMVFAVLPPSIPGFGNAGGFDLYLQDTGGNGHEALIQARNQLLGQLAADKRVVQARPNGQDDTPQFDLDVDQAKATALGVNLNDLNTTLSAAWGGAYVNDFIDRGRVKQVYVQSDAPFRMDTSDIGRWYVRNASGSMVPFSALATDRWSFGSPRLERYNGVAAVELQGQAGQGISSGVAMQAVEEQMAKLPKGYGHEWTGLSFQERLTGSQTLYLYSISLLIVFLSLAALYESWSVPFAVMLTVPIGVLGALLGATLFNQANDVYFQVGLLTTIGLASKNAILIVEFALEQIAAGRGLVEATLHAARQRLRPILMTSLAFILGVLPLAVATGAGSASQNAVGIGVAGGMIAATVLGIFFVPALFVLVRKIFPGKQTDAAENPVAVAAPAE
ncbi:MULTISPECIES: efflux RND transporter permease subunit [Bradyrhizobium]|uniref:efflux RND transporter permease subunit n=1 Tax=Bradyrhizobium TaxID=374 RepID=UPI000403AB01|nr:MULTISPECIES: efflux RND transporter permease subunit [Bradyrhizobium]QOG18929.1 multidrug efflux RND transporter permease subunit [Bradyrhizobium sp. SEMIA]UFW53671.1 multidrug efflux RND transporter permease subunit [Bradyrhizobium arachidis]